MPIVWIVNLNLINDTRAPTRFKTRLKRLVAAAIETHRTDFNLVPLSVDIFDIYTYIYICSWNGNQTEIGEHKKKDILNSLIWHAEGAQLHVCVCEHISITKWACVIFDMASFQS